MAWTLSKHITSRCQIASPFHGSLLPLLALGVLKRKSPCGPRSLGSCLNATICPRPSSFRQRFFPGCLGTRTFPRLLLPSQDMTEQPSTGRTDLPYEALGLHPDPWPPSAASCPLTFPLKPGLHPVSWSPSDAICLLAFTSWPAGCSPLLRVHLSRPVAPFSPGPPLPETLCHRAVWLPGFGPLRFSIHSCSLLVRGSSTGVCVGCTQTIKGLTKSRSSQ